MNGPGNILGEGSRNPGKVSTRSCQLLTSGIARVQRSAQMSGGHPQEEIHRYKAKNSVGPPARENRRQLADGAHRLHQRGGRPVNHANSNGNGEPADSAARPNKKREWRSERNDDRRNQWERKLFLPLHGKARRIKTGLAQACDVIAELPPVHLGILAHLAAKISGWLDQLGKRSRRERLVLCNAAVSTEIADPSRC